VETRTPLLVPRSAVEPSNEDLGGPQPLIHWRNTSAYLLLAEPGAGKTETFKIEAQESGGDYTTARDFVTLQSQTYKSPIFIDGLDEIRAGANTQRGPMDEIRRRLDDLGRPAFRLSCREADWRSAVDSDSLKAVVQNGELAVLHLSELDDADILRILRSRDVEKPEEFLDHAERHTMRPLLGNPLLLGLIADVVKNSGNSWPSTRTEIYQKACEQLAFEYNPAHRAETRQPSAIERTLEEAGLLSALCLLAGQPGIPLDPASPSNPVAPIEMLPSLLGVVNPRVALDSKLFTVAANLRVPRHRTIAEFLAARVIAKRIAQGLPVARVLALMSGADGGIVDPLRGLHAWLATHCATERTVLIDRDPLGVVLYGDLKKFSTQDKKHVLQALHREAQRFVWFRKGHWESHPFGALGSSDMMPTFLALLTMSDRSPAHQSLLGCVFDAIEQGQGLSYLIPYLQAVVLDRSFASGTRLAALDAWLAQPELDMKLARTLLDEIKQGRISDPDDEMAGRLLDKLYPEVVTPREIAGYFHAPKVESLYGLYQGFWRRRFVERTPSNEFREVMDAWATEPSQVAGTRSDFIHNQIIGDLLSAALVAQGDDVTIETLYRWIGVTVGEHGFCRISAENLKGAAEWLAGRPATLKALVAFGWTKVRPDTASGHPHYWESEARTLNARRPPDWYEWLLTQAADTNKEALAQYCFYDAARAAIDLPPCFRLSMGSVESWVASNTTKWPKAVEWLENAWSMPLDHWQRGQKKRNSKYQAEKDAARRERRIAIQSHLESIAAGTAPASLMNQIALAYDERFSDIHGDSPAARVKDFLGGSNEEAAAAINGLEATLLRGDLPVVEDIITTDAAGRSHLIRAACLLGASLAYARDPSSVLSWPDSLARKLVAFWLTGGFGEQPEWFSILAASRPALVAPVLEKYALQKIRRRAETNVTGLWLLAKEDRFAGVARLVVPGLLRAFPLRANEWQLRVLNGELLTAAARHLDEMELKQLVEGRMALKSLDIPQRIAYHVARLDLDGQDRSGELLRLVGTSQSRAAHLGRSLELQGGREKKFRATANAAHVIGRLIELIGPHASPHPPTGAHWVGDVDHQRDRVHQFINQLASDVSTDAVAELARLAGLSELKRWKPLLDGATFDQARARRDATFHLPSIEEVANVLANRSPANPQDLVALFLDHLRIFEAKVHGDDTNVLRLFRRDDRKTSKIENECRDIILINMRDRLLGLGVHLEKEAQAAHDTRADMRLELIQVNRRITVPIEIKKEDDRELWSAWRTQLRTYTCDPASDGIGIYLVLWFGVRPRATPEGVRPLTPRHLLELLSAMIPESDRQRLGVFVLDLSLTSRQAGD